MRDPILDKKVALCLAAAQLAADGDVPPCAAARLAVAQSLEEEAAALEARARRAPTAVIQAREQGYAKELRDQARRLNQEAKRCAS